MDAMRKITLVFGLGASLLLASGTAGAVATQCNSGAGDADPATNADGLNVSDVKYSTTGAAPYTNSNDCYGVVAGNINNGSTIPVWGTGWVYADATDEASAGPIAMLGGSFTFSLTEDTNGGAPTGNYVLSATDNNGGAAPNFPIGLDFVIGLKAGNDHALYFFDDVTFDGSGGGTWSVRFGMNPAGAFPAISHLIAFVRPGSQDCCERDVPEPGTLGLFGLSLLGFALGRRRIFGK